MSSPVTGGYRTPNKSLAFACLCLYILLVMQAFGKTLITIGLIIAAIGAVLYFIRGVPFIGRLPGDLVVQKRNVTFYFPLATSLLLSLILSLLFYLFKRH